MLKVTPDIWIETQLKTIIPPQIKEQLDKRPSKRDQERERRKEALMGILLNIDFYVSCRKAAKLLNTMGITGSPATVNREIRFLRSKIQEDRFVENVFEYHGVDLPGMEKDQSVCIPESKIKEAFKVSQK